MAEEPAESGDSTSGDSTSGASESEKRVERAPEVNADLNGDTVKPAAKQRAGSKQMVSSSEGANNADANQPSSRQSSDGRINSTNPVFGVPTLKHFISYSRVTHAL